MHLVASVVVLGMSTGVLGQWDEHGHGSYDYLERDVVVIGGGAAGTYTAIQLQLMKKSVALIERNNRLGGHVSTYQVPGTYHTFDYGVQLFEDTPVVHEYFNHFNIPLVTVNPSAGNGVVEFADFSTGTHIPASALAAGAGNSTAAFIEYANILSKYPYLEEGNGFYDIPSPVPDELLITWGEFLAQYNLSAIAYDVWAYNQGVGNILDLPMLYQFKYFNSEQVRDTLHGLYQANALQDNQLLYNLALAELSSSAFISSNVTSVKRDRDGVRVLVSTPSGQTMIQASKLVIAIPPLLENLSPFLDLDSEESGLFGEFFYDYYWNMVIKDSGIPDGTTIFNIDPSAPYALPPEPGLYVVQATGYPGLHKALYSTSTNTTNTEVQADVLATIAKLVQGFNFPPTDGTPELVGFNAHNPFELQVSTDTIKDGFYAKLLGLQGKRNTFYTGATWESHNSGSIWNYTESHVLPQLIAELRLEVTKGVMVEQRT